jgi:predicted acylesterase/phospholipase RssA
MVLTKRGLEILRYVLVNLRYKNRKGTMRDSDRLHFALSRASSPTGEAPTDRTQPEQGVGLCLSGGGYRAMLFHAGALWRLNEIGYLPKLSMISSVSGGSIAAAYLGMKWKSFQFDVRRSLRVLQ